MKKILIEQLNVSTFIGVYEWEQQQRQRLLIDLELAYDFSRAAQTDNINDTLDYDTLAKSLIKYLENQRFQLIERVSQACVDFLKQQFNVECVRVRVHKPSALREAKDVVVEWA